MIDVRLVFVAVVIVLGANIVLAVRDSKLFNQLDQQNTIIQRYSLSNY